MSILEFGLGNCFFGFELGGNACVKFGTHGVNVGIFFCLCCHGNSDWCKFLRSCMHLTKNLVKKFERVA